MSTQSIEPDLAVPGVRIADVIVGERARKDYGDLTDLMESIKEHGLLQPIGVLPGNRLLFGGRRLEACRRLGWDSIPFVRPATQDDALSLLRAERDENTCRKDMTPEELVDLGLRLEEMERPKAEARQTRGIGATGAEARWRPDACGPAGPHASASDEPARTAEVVGNALGLSRNTYERMKHVVTTARNEDEKPEVRQAATEVLTKLNAGEITPTAADRKVREARNGDDARKRSRPEPQGPPSPPKYGPRRKHIQVIQSMTTALDGLTIAADGITELDGSVTKEEAAQLVRDLSRQIRSLNRINNLLKECTR